MATALRVIASGHQTAEEPAGYSVKRPVLKFSQIRSGLWAGKHFRRMGEAIWLYGWLHSQVERRTGEVQLYQHKAAAEALEVPERTIRRWLGALKEEGYVEVTRHRYTLTVTITNYKPASPDRPQMADLPQPDWPQMADPAPETGQICPPDWPDLSARLATDGRSITSIGIQSNQSNGGGVVLGGEPTEPEATPPPPEGKRGRPEGMTEDEHQWLAALYQLKDWPRTATVPGKAGWEEDWDLLKGLVATYSLAAVRQGVFDYRTSTTRKKDNHRTRLGAFVRQAHRFQQADAQTGKAGGSLKANVAAYSPPVEEAARPAPAIDWDDE